MSIADLFAYVGAPLANKRWSLGSVRTTDGAVFLGVWQDLKFIDAEGHIYMQICGRNDHDAGTLGYQERIKHAEALRKGSQCFMVMCVATDVETPTRKIADYDQHDVFVGGELLETEPGFRFPARTSERAKYFARNGTTWIRLAGRKPVDEVRPK